MPLERIIQWGSMDLKATTSSMLQLLLLDNTRRWLYFCTHHLPSDGDTETPSPAVLTPRRRRRMVQNLPRQVSYRPFVFLLLLGSMSCHCVHCSTAFSMFFMIVDWCKGRKQQWKDSGHTARDWLFELRMRSDRILNLKNKNKTKKLKQN